MEFPLISPRHPSVKKPLTPTDAHQIPKPKISSQTVSSQTTSSPINKHASLEPRILAPEKPETKPENKPENKPETASSISRQPQHKADYPIGIPRQFGIAAGVAIAVTAGTISHVVNQAPEYEGSFQLAVQIQENDEINDEINETNENQINTPQIEDVNQRITETQIRILRSPRLLDPIIEQLQAENPDLNYRSFTKNLRISRTGDQQLKITYRDTDPERVQHVLEQLAQTYVSYGQECQDETCKGIQFVDAQIPQIQKRVNELRATIQQFHDQHGLKNLEAQVRTFTSRSTEVARQRADIQGKLAETRQTYRQLQARMALSPDNPIAQNLLKQDSRYQTLLQQFQELDSRLAIALSTYQADDPNLQALTEQHKTITAQLHQEAAQVLVRHINNPSANLQDPIFQEPALLELLQQSIGTVHYMKVLETRQQTIEQAEKHITQRKQELAKLLRQYADMRQQLQAETQILQQYFDKRGILEAQAHQQETDWEIAQAPELVTNRAGEPIPDYFHNIKEDVSSAAILGALMGISVGVVLEEKRRSKLNPSLAAIRDEKKQRRSKQSKQSFGIAQS